MRKLTDAELREPYVTLEIPENKMDALPKHIFDVLRLYTGKYEDGKVIYTIPAYLYREWTHQLTQLATSD
jgi:hypothetical protein